jgi:hypothetical protein
MKKITVCKKENGKYFLRVYFSTLNTSVIRFETADEFTKHEADYRAVILSSLYGFDRDELPTHPECEAYPKEG